MNWIKRGRTPLIVTLTLALVTGVGALFVSASPAERVQAVSAMGTGPVFVTVAQQTAGTEDNAPTLKGIKTDHTSVGTCPAPNEIYIEGAVKTEDAGWLELSGCYGIRHQDGAVRINGHYYLLETSRFIAAGYMAGWTEAFHGREIAEKQCLNGTFVDEYTDEVVRLDGCYALNHNGVFDYDGRTINANGVSQWYGIANSTGFYAGQEDRQYRATFPVCNYRIAFEGAEPKVYGPQATFRFTAQPSVRNYQCRTSTQTATVGFVRVGKVANGICDCKPKVIRGSVPKSIWSDSWYSQDGPMFEFGNGYSYAAAGYDPDMGPYVEWAHDPSVGGRVYNETIWDNPRLRLRG